VAGAPELILAIGRLVPARALSNAIAGAVSRPRNAADSCRLTANALASRAGACSMRPSSAKACTGLPELSA
jgi:hypothetical protein